MSQQRLSEFEKRFGLAGNLASYSTEQLLGILKYLKFHRDSKDPGEVALIEHILEERRKNVDVFKSD